MELGFKVVRRVPDHAICDDPPAYLSAIKWTARVLTYRVGRTTEPDHTESGPIAVFECMTDAVKFMSREQIYYWEDFAILAVLYEPTRERVLWRWSPDREDTVMSRFCDFPAGTRFARSVRVLAEIPRDTAWKRAVLKSLPLAG